jgi:hypothetical protein
MNRLDLMIAEAINEDNKRKEEEERKRQEERDALAAGKLGDLQNRLWGKWGQSFVDDVLGVWWSAYDTHANIAPQAHFRYDGHEWMVAKSPEVGVFTLVIQPMGPRWEVRTRRDLLVALGRYKDDELVKKLYPEEG